MSHQNSPSANTVSNKPWRALVTGGGKRIGAELVRKCAEMGFAVHIHVWQSQTEAAELKATLKNSHLHHVTLCNLENAQARAAWLKTLPAFDLIVNNASVYRLTPADGVETPEIRQRYWQVNTCAPLEIIQSQLHHPDRHDRPLLAVNLLDCEILTPHGAIRQYHEPAPGEDSYLSTRIYLAYALQDLALKHAPQLRVNSIAPGPVLPPVNCKTAGMTKILDRVPMKKPVHTSEITAALNLFWHNPSLTGVILPIDGGMHLIPR
ncbi:MAG: SDR family NAD(P)-dependent oxidoreductase [Lentisphaerae bacterium]|nr:SDR family NAD(P)-dependent oxidoreductase [Lentisphaerota bacterium]